MIGRILFGPSNMVCSWFLIKSSEFRECQCFEHQHNAFYVQGQISMIHNSKSKTWRFLALDYFFVFFFSMGCVLQLWDTQYKLQQAVHQQAQHLKVLAFIFMSFFQFFDFVWSFNPSGVAGLAGTWLTGP